jgi:hypothetical protein
MKQSLLIIIALLSFTATNAQSDTVWVFFYPKVGTVNSIGDEYLNLKTDSADLKISLPSITKLSISKSNPKKLFFESVYIIWLSEYNKKNSSVVVKIDKQPKVLLTAGDYLKAGANKQMAGIGVAIGGSVIGGILAAVSKTPTAGLVVVGAGGLVGMILNIAGISDYSKAGQLLNNGKIGNYQK